MSVSIKAKRRIEGDRHPGAGEDKRVRNGSARPQREVDALVLGNRPEAADAPVGDRGTRCGIGPVVVDDPVRGKPRPSGGERQREGGEDVNPECLSAAVLVDSKVMGDVDVTEVVDELRRQTAALNSGDLTRAEDMLLAQAHTLDSLFAHPSDGLGRRS